MAVDALRVVALRAPLARNHPRHVLQRRELRLRDFVVVVVVARVVGTVAAEVVEVAKLKGPDAVGFGLVIGAWRIDALAVFIAGDDGG